MVWTRFMDMHSGGDQKLDWPFLQGRTACAIRAVDAVLRALKEQP